jgi:hypothetical protein
MEEIILYKDLDLSLVPHPLTGDIYPKTNADAVKRALLHLMSWEKWDVPFSSMHHNHLREDLFDLPSNPVKSSIRSKIEWLIKTFEPRVKISEIDVELSQDETSYVITIMYIIQSLLINDNISFYIQRVR